VCVGIGPGHPLDRTRRAEAALAGAEVVVGYRPYLDSIADLTGGKELISSGMTGERERVATAVARARDGARVALVSSGDAGIYGMAGLALEMLHAEGLRLSVAMVPGVTAASAAAASLGAPLMLDFACISLSDLLVPWERIRQRLEAVAAGDLTVALYNPRSQTRVRQLEEAATLLARHRPPSTPVGIVTAASTEEEVRVLSTLDRFLGEDIGMRSLVIIGASDARVLDGWFVAPRGYYAEGGRR
jgi:precorrin-3B C17-methyltransferase